MGDRFYRIAYRVVIPVCRHSRAAGMAHINHWIPASAPTEFLNSAPTVIPAQAGIQEGGAREVTDDRFYRMAYRVVMPVCRHSSLRRNNNEAAKAPLKRPHKPKLPVYPHIGH